MKQNKIYVLTGSIATGKSSVAKIMKNSGLTLIDADEISRRLTKEGGDALPKIRQTFGNEVFENGALNRNALSEIIFSDEEKRRALNSILHPMIMNEMKNEFERAKSFAVFDIPLYFELLREDREAFSGLGLDFPCVIVVSVSQGTQIKRLMKRDGITESLAKKKIASQIPSEEKLKYADYIIDNNGSEEETRLQTEMIIRKMVSSEKKNV